MVIPILYSTGCPKCNVLTRKLDAKGIEYTVNNNQLMSFAEAVSWVNDQ